MRTPGRCLYQPSNVDQVPTEDEYQAIARQFGLFLRRAYHFHQDLQLHADGPHLERAAYLTLSRIATDGPVRLSALANGLCVDPSTISRQVAALEAAGLVCRTRDLSDRRASLVAVTDKGVEVCAHHRDKWLAALRELLVDWTPAERQEFARLFARLNEAIAGNSSLIGHGERGPERENA